MTIISYNTQTPGYQGVAPRIVQMVSTDNLATITAAGYMNKQGQVLEGIGLLPTDELHVLYSYIASTNSGTLVILTPTIASNGTITLVEYVSAGDVLLPVVAGDFATFNGTTGQIKDAGYLPSNAAKTNVVMANGATIVNHIGTFTDVNGTLGEDAATAINGGNIQAGLSGTAGALVSFPAAATNGSLKLAAAANSGGDFSTTISNAASVGQNQTITINDLGTATGKFITSANSAGLQTITSALTVSNTFIGNSVNALQGVLSAGVATGGVVGKVQLFPTTTTTGSLTWQATPNSGNTATIFTTAAYGQASTITYPDPGGTTANGVLAPAALVSGNLVKASGTAGLIVDQGVSMKVVKQAAVAGGAAAQTVTDAACATTSAVIACWNDTSNACSIQKVAAGNGSFVVTSSADPGASHLSYVIYN